ncbi:Protein farnesyltransferase subunit beta [Smittium mucronatum]|nr:Protein farnesyltransferase subunit beta [Smittium mucronatum]
MEKLPSGYQGLNASQPWFCLWLLNSSYLLNSEISKKQYDQFIRKISSLQNKTGGFAGTPTFETDFSQSGANVTGSDQLRCGEQSHLLSSFAAICSLVILGGAEAAALVDRPSMLTWLTQMKQEDGSFTVHFNGEIDLRGSYCALTIAFLLDILTDELVSNVAEFVSRCQNYDGGFGPSPGVESHGSYSFCAIAILDILDRFDCIDMDAFMEYVTKRQMALEGGFNGRINKLVDGCYSYWIGSIFSIVHPHLSANNSNDLLFDRTALQKYIILCCQTHPSLKAGDRGNRSAGGGLRDKPGTFPDYYHTSYCLSGLSVSQNHVTRSSASLDNHIGEGLSLNQDVDSKIRKTKRLAKVKEYVVDRNRQSLFGLENENLVRPVHPVFNISVDKLVDWISLE